MSALAIVITPEETHLYSDGCSTDDNGAIVKDDSRKVHRINEQTAAAHAGLWSHEALEDVLQHIRELDDPQKMATDAAEMIQHYFQDVSRDFEDHPDGFMSTGFWIVTYQEGSPVLYAIDAAKSPDPQRMPIDEVLTMEMVFGNTENRQVFEPYLKTYMKVYNDFGHAGKEAFKSMVSDFMHTGRINEKIYQETIIPLESKNITIY